MTRVIAILERNNNMTKSIPDYKRLFHQSTLMRIVIDKQQDNFFVIEANKAALKYFKADKSEISKQSFDVFLDIENTAHVNQALTVCYESKIPVSIQVVPKGAKQIEVRTFILEPITADNGDMLWIDMQAQPPAVDNSVVERERDDALSMFTTVFDVSEVGITVTDHHGRFVRVNSAFIRQTGWQPMDLVGREVTTIIPDEDHEKAWRRHQEAFKRKRHDFGEIRLRCKDNRVLDVMVTSVIMELSNGRSFRITTMVDITHLKQVEYDLRLAKDAADTANMAKSAFLANMSHELRTPLNAIIGFSEMMINGTMGKIDNPHYIEYLDDIKFSAQHLLQIINDVLDMSKIEAGKMPLDNEDIRIAGLVDSVVRLMQAKSIEKKISVNTDEIDAQYFINGDERLIRQIFLNIMSNAIKFSNEAGAINISTKTSEKSVDIIFEDSGIGISVGKIKDIMEPFGQINDPKLNKGQGTGLGLPIAKAMMEMHGGDLKIESIEGEGTSVICRFPAERVSRK